MKIPKNIGKGASKLDKVYQILEDIADDLNTIKTKVNATHAKLDADTGVNGTDYASTNNIGTLKTIK